MNSRIFRFVFFFLAVGALGFAQTNRPNILLIMLDDMGYGDVGCYNPVQTSHRLVYTEKYECTG